MQTQKLVQALLLLIFMTMPATLHALSVDFTVTTSLQDPSGTYGTSGDSFTIAPLCVGCPSPSVGFSQGGIDELFLTDALITNVTASDIKITFEYTFTNSFFCPPPSPCTLNFFVQGTLPDTASYTAHVNTGTELVDPLVGSSIIQPDFVNLVGTAQFVGFRAFLQGEIDITNASGGDFSA